MTVTIYFAGGEDSDLYTFTGYVATSSGLFRSAYARCALGCGNNGYWQSHPAFTSPATTFWASGWSMQTSAPGGASTNNVTLMGFLDSGLVQRLAIMGTGAAQTYKLVKIDNSGTITQLGSNFTLTNWGVTLMKLIMFVDYKVAGTVTIYQQSTTGTVQVLTYSGDVTTNSATNLSYIRVGSPNQAGAFADFCWSEVMVSDTDLRSWNLQTLAPVANGNTHNFDTGTPAASNVNETTLSDATLDGSTTAGQIDQYTIPAIASGTYTIVAVGVSARMQKGSSGPSKADLGVRSGGTDYWSSDQALTLAWDQYMNWWTTDPNTSATWAALPTNIGLKSVA